MADFASELAIQVKHPFQSDVLNAIETTYGKHYGFKPTIKNAITLLDSINGKGDPDPYFEGANEISEAIEADSAESVEKAVKGGSNFIISLTPKGKYSIPLKKAVKSNKFNAFKALLSLFLIKEDVKHNISKEKAEESQDNTTIDSCDQWSENSGVSEAKGSKKLFRPFGILPLIRRNVERVIENKQRNRLESEISSGTTLINIDELLNSLVVFAVTKDRIQFVKYIIDEFKFTTTPNFMKHLELAISSSASLDLLEYFLMKADLMPSEPSSSTKKMWSKPTSSSTKKEMFDPLPLLQLAVTSNNYAAYVTLMNHFHLDLSDMAVTTSIDGAIKKKRTDFVIKFISEYFTDSEGVIKPFVNGKYRTFVDYAVMYFDFDLLEFLVSGGSLYETHSYRAKPILYLAFIVNNHKALNYLYEMEQISKDGSFEMIGNLSLDEFEDHLIKLSQVSVEFVQKLAQYLVSNEKDEHADLLLKYFSASLTSPTAAPIYFEMNTTEDELQGMFTFLKFKNLAAYVRSGKGKIVQSVENDSLPTGRIPELDDIEKMNILNKTRNNIIDDKTRVLTPRI